MHNNSSDENKNPGNVFIIGSYNVDLIYQLNKFALPGQTIEALDTYICSGGKGTNQAIACSNAGAAVHFTVKIGDDAYADNALKHLSAQKFHHLSVLEEKSCATGTAIVMVSEESNDNCIIINPGANGKISASEVESVIPIIKKSRVFLSQLEINLDALLLCIKHAKDCGVMTIINPAPWNELARTMIPYVDILTPNLSEAEDIVGFSISSDDDVRLAAEKIHNMGVNYVVITLGNKGSWFYDGINHHAFSPYPATVLDTSGAGDAFNGSLAARIAQGNSIIDSIEYASCFSALAVERRGASNMPDHHMVKNRMQSNFDEGFI